MRLMLSWLVLVVLLSADGVALTSADTSHKAVNPNNETIYRGTYNDNVSDIQVREHTVFAQAPKAIAIGIGYYADHPISYNSQAGKQTWIKSKAVGVSVNHEVSSTHNLNQTLDISAQDSSYESKHRMMTNGGVQMKVAEDVQEGKISIGALQGGTSWDGQPPSVTALRNPSLDIEEDYIGDFHIEKNMTLQVPIRLLRLHYSWLPYCSESCLDIPDHNRGSIGAKSVFDYTR